MKMKKILSSIIAASLAVTAVSAAVSAWGDPNPDIWDTANLISNDILKENGVDEGKYAEGATVTVDFKIAGDSAKAGENVVKTNIWNGKDNNTLIYYYNAASADRFDDRVVIGDDEKEFNKSVTVTVGDALEIRYAGNEGFSLTSITLKDGDGNVFATYADGKITVPSANEGTSDDNQNPEETTNGTQASDDTQKPSGDKNQPNTGVEGVAVVTGAAILAAGAIIVSKKRK